MTSDTAQRETPSGEVSLRENADIHKSNVCGSPQCEAYGNAYLVIHLGTGALRGQVRFNRTHDNGQDGLFLCWRVQHSIYEGNQSWNNGGNGISIGHKDTDNVFFKNIVRETAIRESISVMRMRPTLATGTDSRKTLSRTTAAPAHPVTESALKELRTISSSSLTPFVRVEMEPRRSRRWEST